MYLADEAHPWRSVGSREQDRIRLLQTRNELVALDHAVAFEGDTSVFRHLTRNGFGPTGTFDNETLSSLAAALDGATEVEQAYFLAFSSFLGRERWTSDLGTADDNGHGNGFAALWLMDLAQKQHVGRSAIPRIAAGTKAAVPSTLSTSPAQDGRLSRRGRRHPVPPRGSRCPATAGATVQRDYHGDRSPSGGGDRRAV